MKKRKWSATAISDWDDIVSELWKGGKSYPVWTLTGDLGSGKTTLVRALLSHLGSDDHVTSPTFSLVNEYSWNEGGLGRRIYHLDLYRLEDIDDVLSLGIEEILDIGDLILIEWPELADPVLPDRRLDLGLFHTDRGRNVVVL